MKRWILAVGMLAAAAAAAQQGAKPVSAFAPVIKCDETVHDFGERDNSETVEHTYTVRNEGKTSLEITQARPSCGCTVASISSKTVPPGGETSITAKLNLRGRYGAQHKTVTVESNDPATPRLILSMKGTATAEIDVAPRRIYVRELTKGQADRQTLEVVSKATEPVTLVSVQSGNPNVTTEVETVEEGKQYKIHITTSKDMPQGLVSGRVTIRTDSARVPTLMVPFFYQIVGELVVAPRELAFQEQDRKYARSIILRPGTVKQFKIVKVTPPSEDIGVDIRNMGERGYQIRLLDIPAAMELNGKDVLITTDVESMKEVRVPIRVIARRS